jgi:hypothetical protein
MRRGLVLLVLGFILTLAISGTAVAHTTGDPPDTHRRSDSHPFSWDAWRPATCMPDRCFCERIRSGAIRQPANTWSNLGFILVGLSVIVSAARDLGRRSQPGALNPMRTQFAYPAVYGIATLLIGMGSVFYHSSLVFAGQTVDVISIYLLTSFMVIYSLFRAGWTSPKAFVATYLPLNIALGYVAINWPVSRRYIFIVLLLAVLVCEAIVRRRTHLTAKRSFLYVALVNLVAACACWIVDITGTVCLPNSWFQAHAMWHILIAATIGFVYLYYRSETVAQGDNRCYRDFVGTKC